MISIPLFVISIRPYGDPDSSAMRYLDSSVRDLETSVCHSCYAWSAMYAACVMCVLYVMYAMYLMYGMFVMYVMYAMYVMYMMYMMCVMCAIYVVYVMYVMYTCLHELSTHCNSSAVRAPSPVTRLDQT